MYMCIFVYVYMCICVYVYLYIRKMELTENSNFQLFAANGKRKRQTSVCLLQTETVNGRLFFFAANH
jgi:hypothetical protein